MLVSGDCLTELKKIPNNSIDSLVTDPPAGISFMGKSWDSDKGGREQWVAWMTEVMQECLRVLKPGAHGLVWALPRTSHWTATALENAGFEVRDVITHLFGSGFPKATHLKNKRDVFCQCVSDKHNNVHNSLLQHEVVHTDKAETSDGDVSQQSDALHSSNEVQDCQDGYQNNHDFCDELLLQGRVSDQELFPSQQCALKHNHSVEHDDDRASESSGSPSQVRCMNRLSSKDFSLPENFSSDAPSDILQNTRALASNPIQKDSEILDYHKLCNFSESSPSNLGTAFPKACQQCNKPNVDGWYNGGLKPASEHWILVRKPLSEKTVAANVLKHGTGGINIDGCRVPGAFESGWSKSGSKASENLSMSGANTERAPKPDSANGRFPANLVLDEVAAEMLDEQSGIRPGFSGGGRIDNKKTGNEVISNYNRGDSSKFIRNDSGGASRFFYVAKASKSDKGEDNIHPTVKSTRLMEYLIRMITPSGGTVLDPFMGSGSTGVAAKKMGFEFVGIERDESYFDIASKRVGGDRAS